MSEDRPNGFFYEAEQNGQYITFPFPPADEPAEELSRVSGTTGAAQPRRVFGAAEKEPAAEETASGEETVETAPGDDLFDGAEEAAGNGPGEIADEPVSGAEEEAAPGEDGEPLEEDGDDLGLASYKADRTTEPGRDEIKIHYLEAGIGEPLLLIHGIGQSVYTWRNLFEVLSENYRVIAVDLPGHGLSSRPEYFNYSMDEMAEVLHEFLIAKGIESAHMVGFSTGAVYMMRLLTLYPECVANCIAIAPGGISKFMPPLFHRMKKRITGVFARNFYTERTVGEILMDAVSDEAFITDTDVERYYAPISDGLTREALMYAVMNFDMKGTAEELHQVDHEILCVWGRDDAFHPVSGSVYFQNILPAGRFYLIRGAGHLVHEETPERILDVILSYIPSAVTGYDRYPYPQSR